MLLTGRLDAELGKDVPDVGLDGGVARA